MNTNAVATVTYHQNPIRGLTEKHPLAAVIVGALCLVAALMWIRRRGK